MMMGGRIQPDRCLRRHSSRSGGFTLIEVLVTMTLMSIIIPIVMRGISVSLATANSARHTAEAATLAQSKLSDIANQVALLMDTSQVGSSGDFGSDWPTYHWECQSTDDQDVGVIRLTVNVTWNERGINRTFALSTMVQSPDELNNDIASSTASTSTGSSGGIVGLSNSTSGTSIRGVAW